MIEFPNGHNIEFLVASGALGFDGQGWFWEKPLKWIGLIDNNLFTIVLKTITLEPRKGNHVWYNPFKCIRFIDDGVINCIGLSNNGFKWFKEIIIPNIDFKKKLICSITGDKDEISEMIKVLNKYNFVAIEINTSCPNERFRDIKNSSYVIECAEVARKYSKHPIILKLSVSQDIYTIVHCVKNYCDVFSINSVPWGYTDEIDNSPLKKLGGGGLSGKIAQKYNWPLVKKINKLSTIPVIGPSVWDYDDIDMLFRLGAKAISFGSIFLRYPWRPTQFVKLYKKMEASKNANNRL